MRDRPADAVGANFACACVLSRNPLAGPAHAQENANGAGNQHTSTKAGVCAVLCSARRSERFRSATRTMAALVFRMAQCATLPRHTAAEAPRRWAIALKAGWPLGGRPLLVQVFCSCIGEMLLFRLIGLLHDLLIFILTIHLAMAKDGLALHKKT